MGTGLAPLEVEKHHHLQQEPKLKGFEQRVNPTRTSNVQYLVEEGLKEVPDKYIQPLEQRPSMTHAEKIPSDLQIPVIDLKNLQGNHVDMQKVISEVGKACEEWGFFQVHYKFFNLDLILRTPLTQEGSVTCTLKTSYQLCSSCHRLVNSDAKSYVWSFCGLL